MNQIFPVTIDSVQLSRVTGGGGKPTLKDQCGLPPAGGSSNKWGFNVDIPLKKIPGVGKFLPDIKIGGNGQKDSDYKTCVENYKK